MARIRTIKPTLWASEKLGRLSVLARLNFVGLITLADDDGRGRGTIRFLIGQLHGYAEQIDEKDFESSLLELQAAKLVAFYTVENCRYYALPGWRDHQYIEKWRRSELPPVPASHSMAPLFGGERSGSKTPPSIPGKGMEWKGMEGITTAPSAVDLTKGVLGKMDRKALEARLADARIPFDFGEPPDRFVRGTPIRDLSAETCRAILDKMPRLSAELTALLKLRIADKSADMTRAQRAHYGAKA